MTDPAAPPPPPSDRRDAWRAAVLAYRWVRQRGRLDHPARLAAIDAYLEVRPDDGPDEAERRVTRAICYAAAHHRDWFWRGRPVAPRSVARSAAYPEGGTTKRTVHARSGPGQPRGISSLT